MMTFSERFAKWMEETPTKYNKRDGAGCSTVTVAKETWNGKRKTVIYHVQDNNKAGGVFRKPLVYKKDGFYDNFAFKPTPKWFLVFFAPIVLPFQFIGNWIEGQEEVEVVE